MGKKIKKKYYSETAVKKALRIDSFRNLSKEKVMEWHCADSKLYSEEKRC